jgi:hypothetical protein
METQDWHITAQVTWVPGIIASARSNPTRRPPRWSVAEGSRQEQEKALKIALSGEWKKKEIVAKQNRLEALRQRCHEQLGVVVR